MANKKKEITITVELDEENVPTNIIWDATDSKEEKPVACRAMLLSVWDHNRKSTLKLDLWTRKMMQDEMKIFFHQTLVSMADSLERATSDKRITGDMRDFCDYFAERMEIADWNQGNDQ
jgi:gliding motility-associated protein GldC